MSVLIRGMKKPTYCVMCPLCHMVCSITGTKFVCYALEKQCDNDMLADCPLVEVPESHGRLIDGDELVRIWQDAKIYGDIKPLVDVRPTVIEAEGE